MITQKSVPTTNERTIISENKYFVSATSKMKLSIIYVRSIHALCT